MLAHILGATQTYFVRVYGCKMRVRNNASSMDAVINADRYADRYAETKARGQRKRPVCHFDDENVRLLFSRLSCYCFYYFELERIQCTLTKRQILFNCRENVCRVNCQSREMQLFSCQNGRAYLLIIVLKKKRK